MGSIKNNIPHKFQVICTEKGACSSQRALRIAFPFEGKSTWNQCGICVCAQGTLLKGIKEKKKLRLRRTSSRPRYPRCSTPPLPRCPQQTRPRQCPGACSATYTYTKQGFTYIYIPWYFFNVKIRTAQSLQRTQSKF